MTALSGVRSSCDMLARNSDLCRLATSTSAVRTWRALTRSTLRMAIAAWVAKVVRSSVARSLNGSTSGPPDDQDADDLAVEQHGDAHGGPEAAVALDVEPAVLGVGEDVGDLLGPALQPDPAGERAPVLGQRVLVEVGAVLLGEGARRDRQPVRVALEQEDQGDVGPAEVAGAVDDGLQHGVEVQGGAAEDGQHPARRRLLLPGLAEVAPEALDLLAQPPRGPNALHHLDSLEDIPFSQDQSTKGTNVVSSRRTPNTTGIGGGRHGRPPPCRAAVVRIWAG